MHGPAERKSQQKKDLQQQIRSGQGRVGLGLVLLDEKGDFLAKAVRVDDPLAARQRALHHQATHQLSLVPHLMDQSIEYVINSK